MDVEPIPGISDELNQEFSTINEDFENPLSQWRLMILCLLRVVAMI